MTIFFSFSVTVRHIFILLKILKLSTFEIVVNIKSSVKGLEIWEFFTIFAPPKYIDLVAPMISRVQFVFVIRI